MTVQQQKYIDEILEFTQRQIHYNTGLKVRLVLDGDPLEDDLAETVVKAVADSMGVAYLDVIGGGRVYSWVRDIASHILKIHIDPMVSYMRIAELFNKSHVSIMDGIARCEALLTSKRDAHFNEQYKKSLHAAILAAKLKQHGKAINQIKAG